MNDEPFNIDHETLLTLLQDQISTASELQSLKAKIQNLSTLIALEQAHTIRLTATNHDLNAQINYFTRRLEQEAELRASYGKTESQILAKASFPQLAWAFTRNSTKGTLVTSVNTMKLFGITAMAIPCVCVIGAIPVWMVIMLVGSFDLRDQESRGKKGDILEDDALDNGLHVDDVHGGVSDRPIETGKFNATTLVCLGLVVCMFALVVPSRIS